MAAVALKKINYNYLIIGLILTMPLQNILTNLIISIFVVLLLLDGLKNIIHPFIYRTLFIFKKVLGSRLGEWVGISPIPYTSYIH
jgi:hypothetical protein